MNFSFTLFSQRFQLKDFLMVFVSYLLVEGMFSWLLLQNSNLTEIFTKLMGIGAFAFVLFYFNQLNKFERVYVIVFSLLLIRLVLESLQKFNTPFQQLTMFTVLVPVVYAIFIKVLLRQLNIDLLGFLARFYVVSYIAFMLIFGRGFSFSLEGIEMDDYGPFSGDGRILHASKIFMMIIPLLYFLHQYITKRKLSFLLVFLLCVVVIVIHQHRSVWSSCLLALLCYLFASVRNGYVRLGRLGSMLLGAVIISALCLFFISNLFPGFLDFMSDRFSEILQPSKEGSTGNFRIQQREVYSAMAMQRPVFGWTFEGFEMSNPLVDWWPEKTGQHFHEGYIEMLFYHGIVGVIMKYGILVYIALNILSKKISEPTIILSSLCIAALLFSFSYVLPLSFWAHVGLCLFYLEKDRLAWKTQKNVEEEQEYELDYELVSSQLKTN